MYNKKLKDFYSGLDSLIWENNAFNKRYAFLVQMVLDVFVDFSKAFYIISNGIRS